MAVPTLDDRSSAGNSAAGSGRTGHQISRLEQANTERSARLERGRRLGEAGGSGTLVGLADATRPPGGGSEAPYGSPDRADLTQRLAALTAREPETAELVAQGLTGRASADRLYVSRRTVETRVSRACRKPGVSSGTALATLMTRPRTGSGFGDARAAQDRAWSRCPGR